MQKNIDFIDAFKYRTFKMVDPKAQEEIEDFLRRVELALCKQQK